MIEIKSWWTGETIHRDEDAETLQDAVVKAVANRVNLNYASLDGARLDGARLVGARLDGARLVGASLVGARLDGARLDGASLDGARLDGARLDGARLVGARLDGASLVGARLDGARLPSPTMVLLAWWGDLSQQLIADLMLFDSQNHPDPEAFDRWANGGACPYNDVLVSRAAYFQERRELWGKGRVCRPYDLMVRVLAEKCPEWSEEEIAEFMKAFEK